MTDVKEDKIGLQDFQEMLRKRRAPKPKKRSSLSNKRQNKSGEVPEFIVNNQLRWSNFRKVDGATFRLRIFPKADGSLFHEYQSAWVRVGERGQTIISNAWNGERPLPCNLYDKYESAFEDGGYEIAKQYRASRKFAVSAVQLHWFYEVPKTVGENTYYNYVQVPTGGPHGFVEDPRYEDCNKIFGRAVYMDFFSGQRDDFEKQLGAVSANCVNCKEGTVSAVAFSCASCGNVFGDVREMRIPKGELDFLSSGKSLQCESCGEVGPPVVEYQCSKFEGYEGARPVYGPGCDNPTRVDITKPFDIVVRTAKLGGKWAMEIRDIALPAEISELGSYQQNPKAPLNAPLPFDKFLSRIDLESQARAMGMSNPYGKEVETIIDEYFAAASDEEDADSIPF